MTQPPPIARAAAVRPTAYQVDAEGTSPKWCFAFAQGCGGINTADRRLRPGPVAFWGSIVTWQAIYQQALAEGRDYYYGDHAYFHRFKYFRVTRNAMQHTGLGNAGPERFQRLGLRLQPWRKGGRYVLICPPNQVFANLMQFDVAVWLENVERELRCHTDRPLKVRTRDGYWSKEPLETVLAEAWAVVTYMSNVAVDAVLAGVPVFCTVRCAGTTMGLRDLSKIETPIYPENRREWAWNLAANQWTLEEIAAGDCWKSIGT